MGKKSANKFGPQQVPAAAAVSRPSLEKQLHTWEASFESASKVYQSFDMSMSIHVEQDWLHSVLERFQAEGDTDLARWIERFADFCKELVKLKERLHEEYAERWDQANNLVAGIGLREQTLAEQQDAFATAKAAFDHAKAAFEDEQAQLARKKSELLDAERSLNLREANAQAGFVEQNEQALRQLEERQQQLIKQQESSLRELQDEKRKLDAELAQAARRLAEIKYNCSEEESERIKQLAVIRPELDESRRELSSKRVASTELEAVAREKRVLEQHKNTLSVHIDDLESRIEQLTSAQKTQTPFPAMSLMDSGKEYRASMEHESVPGLKQFAEELQHRIATAEEQVELFYPLEDIRLLLGGLAMSQLHVFQGISGTGKTSLAKAFAKAMGGFCTDIAVQAGWRDRDDLLGHYNAFERRFYEKDCLQALYKAQTPRWRDTCNVILLDEMNLSRPEQYFAEFLSALEKNNRDERLISLAETAMPNAPVMLRDGRKILVPSNVWFIGTANHDETTNELADKTYDRAHVMTLPKQDHRFTIKQYDPASFSYASLNKAFDEACNKHRQEVGDLLKWLSEDDLTKQLETDFGLGWGNRFEKQAMRFIPIIKAAGGTEGEALDHLLSTRVMRKGKVTGRYDVSLDALKTLQDALLTFWEEAGLDGVPQSCNQLLEADIRRLEGVN